MKKKLWDVVNGNLNEDEKIFITTRKKLNDFKNENWAYLDEYSFDEIFNVFSGLEEVEKFFHEDGLCIILK